MPVFGWREKHGEITEFLTRRFLKIARYADINRRNEGDVHRARGQVGAQHVDLPDAAADETRGIFTLASRIESLHEAGWNNGSERGPREAQTARNDAAYVCRGGPFQDRVCIVICQVAAQQIDVPQPQQVRIVGQLF